VTGQVRVTRGGIVESAHDVHVAVVNADGRIVASTGNPERIAFMRSAAKPFQALPLVEDGVLDAFHIPTEELALCCASHNAEERHVELAASLLARIGLGEDALECGAHPPMRQEVADRLRSNGTTYRSIHNNCSGKHAGFLALALHHGWDPKGYVGPDHPVQRRLLREMTRWTDVDEETLVTGTDGCGVVTYALPLERMALAFARFAAAAARGEAPARVVKAMQAHPFFVAGTGRLCTAILERAGDRAFVKTGAEGVFGAGVPSRGLGIALKVADGASRAADVALVRVLEELGVLDGDDLKVLESYRRVPLVNRRGELVGHVEADFRLEHRQ
jgi:L-asparaginase II